MNLQNNLVYCLDKAICKSMIACYSQNVVTATTSIHAKNVLLNFITTNVTNIWNVHDLSV